MCSNNTTNQFTDFWEEEIRYAYHENEKMTKKNIKTIDDSIVLIEKNLKIMNKNYQTICKNLNIIEF